MKEHQTGDVIAQRFRLERPLGEGGMGVVWEATQLNLDRKLALKLLHAEHAVSPSARARFEREARVASQLKHPHAVQIYDFGEAEDGALFIAMELLRGQTMRAIVDLHLPPLPHARGLPILAQIADVLISSHELKLVHRDLKPENVFLETAGGRERAVVVDFGLAFITDAKRDGRLTREGIASGTPDYMSPEQAAGDEVGPPSDVYALGAMLYEVLTTRTPFTGSSMQIITQQLFSPPTPPRELRRDLAIPRQLEDLCLWMLAKRPDERPSIEVVHGILSRHRGEEPARERGRDHAYIAGRAARMISAAPRARTTQAKTQHDVYAMQSGVEPVSLAVVGALQGDLSLALGANGLLAFIVSDEQPIDDAHAIYAPGASREDLEALVQLGAPVLTDTPAGNMSRVTELLRAGVDDVVTQPVRAEELARRVWRSVRRHRRRTGEK